MTETTTIKFSQTDYLQNNKCTHQEYYDQFVTEAGIQEVRISHAFKELVEQNTTDVSAVSVAVWNLIPISNDTTSLLHEAGDHWTQAGAVCINKAIARHILSN